MINTSFPTSSRCCRLTSASPSPETPLRGWLKGKRDRLVKLMRLKSGFAPQEYNEDKWILDNLSFIMDFMRRKREDACGMNRSQKSKTTAKSSHRDQLPPNPEDRPVKLITTDGGTGPYPVRQPDKEEDEAAIIMESDGSNEEEALCNIRHEALDRRPTGLPMQEEPSTSTTQTRPQGAGQAPG